MSATLVLPKNLRAEMEILARRSYPRECCGLLLGRLGDGDQPVVLHHHPSRNLAPGNDRYEVDPEDYLAAELAAKSAGLGVIGVWHSHPDHSALPSATDRELAWRDWSYVIVSVSGGELAEFRSWRLDGEGFVEEEICHA